MGCRCVNVDVGSYDNQAELPAPAHIIKWAEKVDFSLGGERLTICVDRCLVGEITRLWEIGVITTGCCCGHGKVAPYIGVIPESVSLMKLLGYSQHEDNQENFTPFSI